MSTKDLFNKGNKVLTKSQEEKIKKDLESPELARDVVRANNKFHSHIDFSKPENFSFYGSAQKYYEDSFNRIYQTYPYDGSHSEKEKWFQDSSELDLWILDNAYPKSTGYVRLGTEQSIFVKGGPNKQPGIIEGEKEELSKQFPIKQGNSNIWDTSIYRNSNLYLDAEIGNTIEFWAKMDNPDITVFPFVIGNIDSTRISFKHNNGLIEIDYTDDSGSGFSTIDAIGATFMESTWNHFAFTFINDGANAKIEIYKNGTLLRTLKGGSALSSISQEELYLNINGTMTAVNGTRSNTVDGLYIDEFRFWKRRRAEEEIARFWHTHVHGGTNTDEKKYNLENRKVDLGVYYKFNEGITGNTNIDSTVLDYSGRISNGEITNYDKTVRNTGSSFDESGFFNVLEDKEPIIYSAHPDFVSVKQSYMDEGLNYDYTNNSSIYHTMPAWIIEEDEEKGENVKELSQVISSYFDSAQIKIKELVSLKDVEYHTLEERTNKPYSLIRKTLESAGMVVPDLFTEASAFEEILSRGEQEKFEEKLQDIKNTIYQNIYNNLSYIYKSKGTEKAFRNLIRCFGIDDELVKINLYSDGADYTLEDTRRTTAIKKKFVDFNDADRQDGLIYTKEDPSNTNSTSYIRGVPGGMSPNLSFTFQTELIFPKRVSTDHPQYDPPTNLEEHIAYLGRYLGTYTSNSIFDLKAVKENSDPLSENVKFVLTFNGQTLETDYFKSVYENSKWNLAVRLVPKKRLSSVVSGGSTTDFTAELYCVRMLADVIEDEEWVVGTVLEADARDILSSDKFVSVGALHSSGNPEVESLDKDTRIKISSTLFWYDDVSNEEIRAHASDASNFGRLHPNEEAYMFDEEFNTDTSSAIQVPRRDTLVMHWDFSEVSTTDISGEFIVDDLSQSLEIQTETTSSVATNQNSIVFDGSDDHIIVSDQDEFSPTDGVNDTPFSISAWVYVEDVATANGPFVTKSNNSGSQKNEYIFKQQNGEIQFFLYDSDLNAQGNAIRAQATVVSLSNATWHHVVATYDGSADASGIKLYTDGALTASANTEAGTYVRLRNTVTPLTFGATTELGNNNRIFEDRLADICIFDKELSAAEVTEIFNGNSVKNMDEFSDTASIISWWKMGDHLDNLSTDGIKDYVGGFHGTLQNGAAIAVEPGLSSDTETSVVSSLIPINKNSIAFDGTAASIADTDIVISSDDNAFTFSDSTDVSNGTVHKPFTISAWINPSSLADRGAIITKFSSMSVGDPTKRDTEFVFWHRDNGELQFILYDCSAHSTVNNITITSNTSVLTASQWQQVAVTFDGNPDLASTSLGMKLYVDGQEVPSTQVKAGTYQIVRNTESPVTIGAAHYDHTNVPDAFLTLFEGNIADTAVYSKELNSFEIQEIYNGGKVKDLNDSSTYDNIISWWKMGDDIDSATPNGIRDYVGGFHGTMHGQCSIQPVFGLESDSTNSLLSNSRFGWFTDLVGREITGRGKYFTADDKQVVNREYIYSAKHRTPEVINSEDLVEIRTQDDLTFTKDAQVVTHFFAAEKSMYQVISDDMINLFATIVEFNDLIGQPVNRYRLQYKALEKFRARYFEKVNNVPSLEKYIELYKWIDSSIGLMLQELIPVSSNFSADLRNMVESHVLERNKYWTKFPTLEMAGEPPLGIVKGINELTYNWKDGHPDYQISEATVEFFNDSASDYDNRSWMITDSAGFISLVAFDDDNVFPTGHVVLSNPTQIMVQAQIFGLTTKEQIAEQFALAFSSIPNLSATLSDSTVIITGSTPLHAGGVPFISFSSSASKTSFTEVESSLWYDQRVQGTDALVTTGDTDVDENREILRRVSTRKTGANTQVTKRGSDFVEEDRPILRESPAGLGIPGAVYSGQAYVIRALAKPYKLNLDIAPTIHGGANYSPTTKDPNSFVRASTKVSNSSGIAVTFGTNPVIYQGFSYDDQSVKRTINIVVEDSTVDFGADGDFIYPYYETEADPTPEITNLQNDSYGEDAEIPVQGPFTETWVGGNQHRHIHYATQTDRPELFVDDSGTLKHPFELGQPAARYTRDELAKRPVNVENIKNKNVTEEDLDAGTETKVYGNYTRDYEIVQTSGRSKNNRWFIKNEGVADVLTVAPIDGAQDFALPDRTTDINGDVFGKSKHVIVERFSAPGDPLTLSRGYLDRVAEEFSVYNSMNFRNLDERDEHREDLTAHSAIYEGSQGYVPDTNGLPNIHKVNRNTIHTPTGKNHDNAYISHQIPRSDFQYNVEMISDEAFTIPDFSTTGAALPAGSVEDPIPGAAYNFIVEEYADPIRGKFTISFDAEEITSVVGENLYFQYKLDSTWTTLRVFAFGTTLHQEEVDLGQNFHNPIYIRWIARKRITGGDGRWNVSNISVNPTSFQNYLDEIEIVNGINDYADYQGAGYRFIRNSENSQIISQRKANIYTQLNRTAKIGLEDRSVSTFVEPAVVWNKPNTHYILNEEYDEKVRNAEAGSLININIDKGSLPITYSYSNNLEMFSNEELTTAVDIDKTSGAEFSNTLMNIFRKAELLFSRSIARQIVFPKHKNVGLKKTRVRSKFDTYKFFWKDSMFDRIKCSNTTKLGYEMTPEFKRLFRQKFSVDVMDNFHLVQSGSLSGPHEEEFYKVIGDLTYMGEERMRHMITKKGASPLHTSSSVSFEGLEEICEEETPVTGIVPNYSSVDLEAQKTAPIPSPQLYHNPYNEDYRESEGWINRKVISKKTPNYNDYDSYSEEIKLAAQNYGLVSEFRISEHMDKYILENGGNFRAKNYDFLTLDGASYDGEFHTLSSGTSTKETTSFYSLRKEDESLKITSYPTTHSEETLIKNNANGYLNFNPIASLSNSTFALENSVNSYFEINQSNQTNYISLVPHQDGINASGKFNLFDSDEDYLVIDVDNVQSRLGGVNLYDSDLLYMRETASRLPTPITISAWVQPEDKQDAPADPSTYSNGLFCFGGTGGVDSANLFSTFRYASGESAQSPEDYRNLGLTFTISTDGTNNLPGGTLDSSSTTYTFFKKNGTIAFLEQGKMNSVIFQLIPPEDESNSASGYQNNFLIKLWLNGEELYGVHIRELDNANYSTRVSNAAAIHGYSPCPIGSWQHAGNYPWTTDADTSFDSSQQLRGEQSSPAAGIQRLDKFVLGNCHYINSERNLAGTKDFKFRGLWDEFAIFRGILPRASISAIYNDGLPNNINELVANGQIIGNCLYDTTVSVPIFINGQFISGPPILASSDSGEFDVLGGSSATSVWSFDTPSWDGTLPTGWLNNESDEVANDGPVVISHHNNGNQILALKGNYDEQADVEDPPHGGGTYRWRWVERNTDFTGTVVVTFQAYEGQGDPNEYNLDAPESGNNEDLFLQYERNNSGTWTTVVQLEAGFGYDLSQTIVGKIENTAGDSIRLRWIARVGSGASPVQDHWGIDTVNFYEYANDHHAIPVLGGDTLPIFPQTFTNNYSISEQLEISATLPVWHRIGVPSYDVSTRDGAWDEEFFNSYVHTDDLNFIEKADKKHDELGVETTERVRLKVNAIKKLLPYEGFYPQDRTVQLANLFVEKVTPDITYDKNVYKEQAVQAALQHFFAPGILYNSIKAGVACDWASYTNENGLEPAHFGQPILAYSASTEAPYTMYSSRVAPSWYSDVSEYTGEYSLLSDKPNSIEDATYWDATDTFVEHSETFNYDYNTNIDNNTYDISGSILLAITSSIDGMAITNEPNVRLPFESLLNPYAYLKNEEKRYKFDGTLWAEGDTEDYIIGKPNQYFLVQPSYLKNFVTLSRPGVGSGPRDEESGDYKKYNFPYFEINNSTQNRDYRYELAMNNFLAQATRFFIKDESLSSFASTTPQSDGYHMESGKTYYMDVVLSKSDSFKNTYTGGRSYGPPHKWIDESYYDTVEAVEDPSYAPYTPAYFYGESTARISFTPSTTKKYTLDDIFDGSTVEDVSPFVDEYFRSSALSRTHKGFFTGNIEAPDDGGFKNSSAYNSKMHLSASIELFGKTKLSRQQYDASGNPVSISTPNNEELDTWVIYSKFECPLFDFSGEVNSSDEGTLSNIGITSTAVENKKTENFDYTTSYLDSRNSESYNVDTRTGSGIWSGYGRQQDGSGVTISIRESFPQGISETTGSLIEVCGFTPETKQLGRVADSKEISEAVVMIPFVDRPITSVETRGPIRTINYETVQVDDRNFIKVDEQEYEEQVRKFVRGEPIYITESGDEIMQTSITRMLEGMKKYNVPPLYDFNQYSEAPFAMYFFEFKHTLDREDLSNIWQGLQPQVAREASLDSVEISHEINEHELFGNLGEIPKGVRWMVFKVKKKAEKSYYKLTEDSRDDSRFKFDFEVGTKEPEYGYNYPYDYFTMLEMIEVETNSEKEIQPLDQLNRARTRDED